MQISPSTASWLLTQLEQSLEDRFLRALDNKVIKEEGTSVTSTGGSIIKMMQ